MRGGTPFYRQILPVSIAWILCTMQLAFIHSFINHDESEDLPQHTRTKGTNSSSRRSSQLLRPSKSITRPPARAFAGAPAAAQAGLHVAALMNITLLPRIKQSPYSFLRSPFAYSSACSIAMFM